MKPQAKKNKLLWNEEEKRRIVGFFDLLIKVDKRINPHLYLKKPNEPIEDRNQKKQE